MLSWPVTSTMRDTLACFCVVAGLFCLGCAIWLPVCHAGWHFIPTGSACWCSHMVACPAKLWLNSLAGWPAKVT